MRILCLLFVLLVCTNGDIFGDIWNFVTHDLWNPKLYEQLADKDTWEEAFRILIPEEVKDIADAVANKVADPLVKVLNTVLPIEIPPAQCWIKRCGLDPAQARARAGQSKLKDWMKEIPDDTSLSDITIPGTHNSGAIKGTGIEGVSAAYIQCQEGTILQQLEWGIRALDIRGRHIHNGLAIHHSSVYMGYGFGHVLDMVDSSQRRVELVEVVEFLKAHPSEVVLMRLQSEHTEEGNTRAFYETANSILAPYHAYQYKTEKVPKLGDARGKFIIIRNYESDGTPNEIPWNSLDVMKVGCTLKRIQHLIIYLIEK